MPLIDPEIHLTGFARRMVESPIRDLLKRQNEEGMISMGGGFPDPDNLPVTRIMGHDIALLSGNRAQRALLYGPTGGPPEFVNSVAGFISNQLGQKIDPESVVWGNGSQHLGFNTFFLLAADPGDAVIMGLPTYLGMIVAGRPFGTELIGVPLDDQGMQMDKLEEALQEHSNVKFIYVVPDFQNPTGITMTLKRRQRLVALAERYNVLIVEDTPYREMNYGRELPPSIFSLDENERTLHFQTTSKISCCDRLGFGVVPLAFARWFNRALQAEVLCGNQQIMLRFADILKEGWLPEHMANCCLIYQAKRDIMLKALEDRVGSISELSWTKPSGGLFLWLTLPEHKNNGQPVDTAVLCASALEPPFQVLTIPGTHFHCDQGGKNTIRLNFSYPRKELIEPGITRLGNAIDEYLEGQLD